MSNSGLINIHVLEETASRVSGLTTSITKQISVIDELSYNARKGLGPTSNQTRNLGKFRENAASVLSVYEMVEKAAVILKTVYKDIEMGPVTVGWRQYMDRVASARQLSIDLSESPQLARFTQLVNYARQIYESGAISLQNYVKRLSGLVYEPTRDLETIGEFQPENVGAIATLVNFLDEIPELSVDKTDGAVLDAMENYLRESLAPLNKSSSEYRARSDKARTGLLASLDILCEGNPQRFQRMHSKVNRLVQLQTENSAAAKPGSDSRSPSMTDSPKFGTPSQQQHHQQPHHPQQRASTEGRGSKQPSIEAMQGPRINNSPQRGDRSSSASAAASAGATAGGAGSAGRAGLPPINTNLAPGNDGPNSARVLSPSNSESTGAHSFHSGPPPSVTSSGPSWTAFEQIENGRNSSAPEEEMTGYKREGLAMLMQVFVDIETQCKKSPITSEFGVSGASLQFMKTLQNIHSAGHGVDVVLSEVSTRAYLTKPPPAWAARSEPTPAARANPVSLYYSDALLCLYSMLHDIAAEQLSDTSKVGIFMLSNLTAIEHYITNSKTESIASVPQKTPLMDHMGDVALQKFQQLMIQAYNDYTSEWRKLAPTLMESTITGAASSKMSSKDRDTVKEKFKSFNNDFETLIERQKRYQVSDPVLRARMSQETKKLICPLYLRLYQKHKDGDFTKNIAKYIKYTPPQIEEAMTL